MKLYQVVARELGGMIRGGTLRSGDRLPSVRVLCNTRRVSPSTVLRAYEILESEGLIEARSRSGYYVSERRKPAPEPRTSIPKSSSTRIAVSDLVFDTLEASRDRKVVPLGSAFPARHYFHGQNSPGISAAAPGMWIRGARLKACRLAASNCAGRLRAATCGWA